jgi:hypothetical protein
MRVAARGHWDPWSPARAGESAAVARLGRRTEGDRSLYRPAGGSDEGALWKLSAEGRRESEGGAAKRKALRPPEGTAPTDERTRGWWEGAPPRTRPGRRRRPAGEIEAGAREPAELRQSGDYVDGVRDSGGERGDERSSEKGDGEFEEGLEEGTAPPELCRGDGSPSTGGPSKTRS